MCRAKGAGGRRCSGHRSPEEQRAYWRTAKQAQRARQQAKSSTLNAELTPTAADSTKPSVDYSSIKGDERTQAILTDLTEAVNRIATSGKVEQWLNAMASNGMNRWSANNRILAYMQLVDRAERENRPELLDDVHLMSFKQWKERHGRTVSKGEKAIWILAPRTRRIEEEDENGDRTQRTIVTGFTTVPVFNITQTAGPSLPEAPIRPATGEVPAHIIDGLRTHVSAAGYTYREEPINGCNPDKGTGTLGYTSPASREIVVDSRLSPHQKASTIAHELGHVHAGHVDHDHNEYQQHRGQMETEAEAAAYLTCRRLGIDKSSSEAFSPGYIAGWMAQKGADFGKALERAVSASNKILESDWHLHGRTAS